MSEQSERMKVASDALLSALRTSRYPNCTLYIIWHHLERGNIENARLEYACDHDKLGAHRVVVENALLCDTDNSVISTEKRVVENDIKQRERTNETSKADEIQQG